MHDGRTIHVDRRPERQNEAGHFLLDVELLLGDFHRDRQRRLLAQHDHAKRVAYEDRVNDVVDKTYKIDPADKNRPYSRVYISNFLYRLEEKSRRVKVTHLKLQPVQKQQPDEFGGNAWTFDAIITSRQSTMRFRDSDLPVPEIARQLGVDALVEGSLLREGSKIEVTIQLIDRRSDAHLWAERYTSETPYVFSLISDMANSIGAEIRATGVSTGVEGPSHDRIGPIDPRAIDAYALGIMYFDRFTRDGIASGIASYLLAR